MTMESDLAYIDARALLEWQLELGVTDAIEENTINRYVTLQNTENKIETPQLKVKTNPNLLISAIKTASDLANAAKTLEELRVNLQAYEYCDLKLGAKNLVFCDGDPQSKVMIVGDAPNREEDMQGRPFVGTIGQLLDKMFSAIEYGRDHAKNSIYITNVIPWRPPQDREPYPEEVDLLLPFLIKHIDLIKPKVLVLMGNMACMALIKQSGITRIRGKWQEFSGIPVLPMFHPSYLLRTPSAKREAWNDLKMLQEKLEGFN